MLLLFLQSKKKYWITRRNITFLQAAGQFLNGWILARLSRNSRHNFRSLIFAIWLDKFFWGTNIFRDPIFKKLLHVSCICQCYVINIIGNRIFWLLASTSMSLGISRQKESKLKSWSWVASDHPEVFGKYMVIFPTACSSLHDPC